MCLMIQVYKVIYITIANNIQLCSTLYHIARIFDIQILNVVSHLKINFLIFYLKEINLVIKTLFTTKPTC